jgi:aspartate-semialdehyde dehydrogenase
LWYPPTVCNRNRKAAVDQLNAETEAAVKGETTENIKKVYPYQIFKNALPQCDVFRCRRLYQRRAETDERTEKIMHDDSFD